MFDLCFLYLWMLLLVWNRWVRQHGTRLFKHLYIKIHSSTSLLSYSNIQQISLNISALCVSMLQPVNNIHAAIADYAVRFYLCHCHTHYRHSTGARIVMLMVPQSVSSCKGSNQSKEFKVMCLEFVFFPSSAYPNLTIR